MVLSRLAWAFLALAGCLPRHAPVRAEEEREIAVVPVLASVERAEVDGGPEALERAIAGALAARNVRAATVPEARYVEAFAVRRDTARRLEALAVDGPLLLVETEASFYSQLSGKYRWTVAVTLTLAPAGLTDRFEVPVFLQYHHEREEDALAAAAPVIARRAGALVDGWLGGGG